MDEKTKAYVAPEAAIITPLVTPLKNGAIDESSLVNAFTHAVNMGKGANAIFGYSTTSEGWSMPLKHRHELRNLYMEAKDSYFLSSGHDTPLWLNSTSANPDDDNIVPEIAIDYEIFSGADAVVVTPLRHHTEEEITEASQDAGLYRSLFGDFERSPIPIILYFNPRIHRSGTADSSATLATMLEQDKSGKIIAAKVSDTPDNIANYVNAANGRIKIYSGNETSIYSSFNNKQGISGGVFGTSGAFPSIFYRIMQAKKESDLSLASADIDMLRRIRKIYGPDGSKNIAAIKHLLMLQEVIETDEVYPGTPKLDADDKEHLERLLLSIQQYEKVQ